MNTIYYRVTDPAADREKIEHAGQILRDGGLVAIPTETVYGLAANALNPEAVKAIFTAKGRPQDNPLIVHISDYSQVEALVEKVDERLPALAKEFWPGPLTVIMKKSPLVPNVTSGGLDTVAIRMPSDPVAAAIIKAAGVPLAAPSANSSGKPSPTRAEHVTADMDGKIEMIVDGGQCDIGVESTVITLVTEPPTLLRPGGVIPEELERILGEIEISPAVFASLKEGETAASPGMKYKHYSPAAKVVLIKGNLKRTAAYVRARDDGSTCVLCFEGEEDAFTCPSIVYGRKDDGLSQANGAFDALRKVDESGFKTAFVRCPDPTGVGLAVYNRLLRSAAFNVVELDTAPCVIGFTGQTGAGKSTVSQWLGKRGFIIVDGDILAREAVKQTDVLAALAECFGDEVILPDGSLNRKKTAEIAFSSPENTAALNAITHPAITRLALEAISSAKSSGAKGVVIEAAALIGSPIMSLCDLIASVTAPAEEREKRIIARDNLTVEEARRRMSAQYDDEYYARHSDIIIKNGSGDDFTVYAEELIKAVDALNEGV